MNNLDKTTWENDNLENLERMRKFWDLRAEEFNSKISTKDKTDMVEFLMERGALNKEYDVLDLGCGPGKYALEFAPNVKNIIGIDLSENMIEYAVENAKSMKINNLDFLATSWESLNLNEAKWNKKFDLVFASMTPAINSKNSLLKMIEASRKHCFLSGFVYRTDSVRDEIRKHFVDTDKEANTDNKIYRVFNELWALGIHPEITYKTNTWFRKVSLEKAISEYEIFFEKEKVKGYKDVIRKYLESITVDGEIEEVMNSKVAYMFWNV